MARYRFSDFILSPRKRLLVRGGRELPLIPRYFDLLVFLVEHRHEAVHRREIFDRVWNDAIVSDSALSQAIRTLRRTLDDDTREPTFIRTVSRHGYQFVYPEVVEEEDEDDALRVKAEATEDIEVPVASTFRWKAAAGAALAGAIAGVAGGLVLLTAPGSTASTAIVAVLACIGGLAGLVGGLAVTGGIALAEARLPAAGRAAPIVGSALGGLLVGAAVQWLMRWSLAALVGVTVETGGALEGLVIGAAAGLGYVMTAGRERLVAMAVMALLCGTATSALTYAGRPLVGGTLHAISRQAKGSQMSLVPLGRLLGETDFGPLSRALIGAGEGMLFGIGVGAGLGRRRSPTSHRTLNAQ